MQPTTEQSDARDLFASGIGLAIEAGAGTGKTTTLKLLGQATTRRGAYVAFNRAIVEEAKAKMPSNVRASTAHSLAFGAKGKEYRHRLNSGRMRSDDVARRLDLMYPCVITYGEQKKVLQPGYLASLAQRAITRFCQSADDEPNPSHVPYVDGIDQPDANGRRTYANNDRVRELLSSSLRVAWADICDLAGVLPFHHDHYLKLWQLDDPKIAGDFVLFDEAQDAAPVMLAAVEAQRSSQLVFVGDSQQQIYEWRGAVNALEQVPSDARTFLTQSFRFGPAIAEVANAILERLHAELRLSGTPSIDSIVESEKRAERPACILTRTNAKAVSTVLALQMVGQRPHLMGGGREVADFAKAAGQLKAGERTWHRDLCCFVSWGEVQEYVSNDPQGDELKLLVGLVDDFGVDTIVQALDPQRMPPEEHADVVISTVHKAKGREWPSVQLTDDFPMPDVGAMSEWRLLYVAATRAQFALDVSQCQPLRELVEGEPEPVTL